MNRNMNGHHLFFIQHTKHSNKKPDKKADSGLIPVNSN